MSAASSKAKTEQWNQDLRLHAQPTCLSIAGHLCKGISSLDSHEIPKYTERNMGFPWEFQIFPVDVDVDPSPGPATANRSPHLPRP